MLIEDQIGPGSTTVVERILIRSCTVQKSLYLADPVCSGLEDVVPRLYLGVRPRPQVVRDQVVAERGNPEKKKNT